MKAELLLSGANSWSTVCLHAASIHPPAAAQAAEAEASRGTHKGREAQETTNSAKAKCSQMNFSNDLGTSQKVGLVISKARNSIYHILHHRSCNFGMICGICPRTPPQPTWSIPCIFGQALTHTPPPHPLRAQSDSSHIHNLAAFKIKFPGYCFCLD